MIRFLKRLWQALQFRTNWKMWYARKKLEKAYKRQVVGRQLLRQQINKFLKDFFGIDAQSKYIPKKYKNSAEVKEATLAKFGEQMHSLNVSYDQLFK